MNFASLGPLSRAVVRKGKAKAKTLANRAFLILGTCLQRLAEICSPRDFLRMDAKQILVASRRL